MRKVNAMIFPKHCVDMQHGATTRGLDETCFTAADHDLPIFSWLGVCSHLQHAMVGNVQDLDGDRFIFSLRAVKMRKQGRTGL